MPKENLVATVLLAACICRSAAFGEPAGANYNRPIHVTATNKKRYRSDTKLLSRAAKGGR